MTTYRELLIGCGRSREKRVIAPNGSTIGPTDLNLKSWFNLTTLDSNPDVNPDIVWDLERWPLPFDDDTFSEIHAYEVLEHLGAQGSVHAFFGIFAELYRILRTGGYLCATTPSRRSPWLWGDPGHTRAILPESLTFLDQSEYVRQCDSEHPTPMSDYRALWRGDFKTIKTTDDGRTHLFILQAVKWTKNSATR